MRDTEEDEKLRSSAQQFVEFLDSTVWQDIEMELNKWLEGIRDKMEIESGDELLRNQGRANAMRYMIGLPQVMKEQLIEEQKEREREVKKDGE
jgi:hypothetical protein